MEVCGFVYIIFTIYFTSNFNTGVGGIVSYEYNDEYDDEYYVHAPIYESYDPNIYTRLLSF